MNTSSLIPLAAVGLVLYLLHRQGMQIWQAIVCILAGVILACFVLGPNISSILSQLSGGALH